MKLKPMGDHLRVFYCPGCETSHIVKVQGDGAWELSGPEQSPTLRPSVLTNRNRLNPTAQVCHLYITDGYLEFGHDCTHSLAGQRVLMVELP